MIRNVDVCYAFLFAYNKKSHTVGTFPKSNRIVGERDKNIDTTNTHIHGCSWPLIKSLYSVWLIDIKFAWSISYYCCFLRENCHYPINVRGNLRGKKQLDNPETSAVNTRHTHTRYRTKTEEEIKTGQSRDISSKQWTHSHKIQNEDRRGNQYCTIQRYQQ
jgi:hypothetical protein